MMHHHCPHCELLMKIKTIQGIAVEYCESCQGICLHKGELDKVASETEGSIEYATITDQQLEHQDSRKVIDCPKCYTPSMRKVEFLSVTDVILDRCDNCGALWLDQSELEQINARIASLNDAKVELPFWSRIRMLAVTLGSISL